MKILVAVKQVGIVDEDFEIRDDGKDIDEDFLDYEINEWDNYSWEVALQLKESYDDKIEIIPITVGPEDANSVLLNCLAKGGERGIRVWDDAIEPADSMAIARIIAKVAQREEADIVLAGTLSSDRSYAATGMCVAGLLGWAHAAVISKLDINPDAEQIIAHRELEAGVEEEIIIQKPTVLSIQLGINNPRYASLRGIKQAKAKPLDVLSPMDLGLSVEEIGELGSLSKVRKMYIPKHGQAELIEGTVTEQAIGIIKIIKELRGDS